MPEAIVLLLAQGIEQRDYDDGSQIFHVEHIFPFDLLPYPLDIDFGFVLEVGGPDRQLVIIEDDLLAVFINKKDELLGNRNFGCLKEWILLPRMASLISLTLERMVSSVLKVISL